MGLIATRMIIQLYQSALSTNTTYFWIPYTKVSEIYPWWKLALSAGWSKPADIDSDWWTWK